MKKALKFWGIITLVAVIGFGVFSCDDGGDPPGGNPPGGTTTSQYLSYDTEGNLYTLTITQNSNDRSLSRTVNDGDSYELRTGIKISSGVVSVDNNGNLVLTPTKGTLTITVTISNGNMTSITGTITWDDETTSTAPGNVTPFTSNETDPALNGTWVSYQEMVIQIPGQSDMITKQIVTFTFDNGNYNSRQSMSLTNNTFRDNSKGTYFTGNGIMAMTPTHIHGDTIMSLFAGQGINIESKWYAKNEIDTVKNAIRNSNINESLINSFISSIDLMFGNLDNTVGGYYEIDGNYAEFYDAEAQYSITYKKHTGGDITIHETHDWDDNWVELTDGLEGRYCKDDRSHMQMRLK